MIFFHTAKALIYCAGRIHIPCSRFFPRAILIFTFFSDTAAKENETSLQLSRLTPKKRIVADSAQISQLMRPFIGVNGPGARCQKYLWAWKWFPSIYSAASLDCSVRVCGSPVKYERGFHWTNCNDKKLLWHTEIFRGKSPLIVWYYSHKKRRVIWVNGTETDFKHLVSLSWYILHNLAGLITFARKIRIVDGLTKWWMLKLQVWGSTFQTTDIFDQMLQKVDESGHIYKQAIMGTSSSKSMRLHTFESTWSQVQVTAWTWMFRRSQCH